MDSTGATSTSGRFIFAALMFRLPFASIATTVQAGFVIGIRVLLDTFLLRTITVPAVAVLVGQANWWPSRLRPPTFERAQRVLATHRPMNDVHRRRVQTRVTVPPTVTNRHRHRTHQPHELLLHRALPVFERDGQPKQPTTKVPQTVLDGHMIANVERPVEERQAVTNALDVACAHGK